MIKAVTTSVDATRSLGAAVAALVQERDLILLSGDLGSGKTTFTQGFGAALGVDEQITSPTFVLVRTYEAKIRLHHADVYRLEHLDEVVDLGLLELLDEGGVALIEWGDIAEPAMPRDFLEIRFGVDEANDENRVVFFKPVGNKWGIREKVITEAIGPWLQAGEK
jgi:tRNA threonylcarbamoyladenosine biosynthesis protein TsaE